MKLHEYQTKEILKKKGIKVPMGMVVEKEEQLKEALKVIPGPPWVLKAQVHAGGRGKAGGILKVKDPLEATQALEGLLNKRLVTHQTGEKGVLVSRLLLEEVIPHRGEYYVGITLDRSTACPTLLYSTMGGMEIEEVAKDAPESLIKVPLDPLLGLVPFKAREALYGVRPLPDLQYASAIEKVFQGLYSTFMEYDCSLLEINPLVISQAGEVVALDAKMALDENAGFRHKELVEDRTETDPLEMEASRYGLSYIRLEGDVGVMVNGAGLAMATMDIIKLAGAMPANFLDVGGGASKEMVRKGFEIILMDPNVKMILVNIFGGILRCDVLANGILEAVKGVRLDMPLIIRLEGTNVEEGRRILKESGLQFSVAGDLKEAVEIIRDIRQKRA